MMPLKRREIRAWSRLPEIEKSRDMANTLKRLSIWEIAHRWHGEDPEQTDQKRLPLVVRDTIRSLTRGIHYEGLRVVNNRGVENHSAFHPQSEKNYTAEEIQNKLSESYEKSFFDRGFLEAVCLEREDLGKWCQEKGIALPVFWFSDQKSWADVSEGTPESVATLRPVQIDKIVCQAIARTLWDIYPTMTISDMTKHLAIQNHGGGKNYKGAHTLREWLSDVAPPEVKGKPGRPKKPGPQ